MKAVKKKSKFKLVKFEKMKSLGLLKP